MQTPHTRMMRGGCELHDRGSKRKAARNGTMSSKRLLTEWLVQQWPARREQRRFPQPSLYVGDAAQFWLPLQLRFYPFTQAISTVTRPCAVDFRRCPRSRASPTSLPTSSPGTRMAQGHQQLQPAARPINCRDLFCLARLWDGAGVDSRAPCTRACGPMHNFHIEYKCILSSLGLVVLEKLHPC
jgi:hypothetical protein